MKAQELIDILALNPNAEIVALHTQYDGCDDKTTWEGCQVVTNGDTFVLSSTNFYDKQTAVEGLSPLTVSRHRIDALAKLEDPCIYVD